MRKGILFFLIFVIGAVILGGLALSVWIYDLMTLMPPQCTNTAESAGFTPAQFASSETDVSPYLMLVYEAIRFPARSDAINLSGFYIPAEEDDSPAVIVVPGHWNCKRVPQALLPAGMLHRNGYHVLVLDLRNMGDSDIETGRVSFGAREYRDVLGAWDWLVMEKGIPPERIGVFGYSLGGAASIIAAAEEPHIAALWLDSSFADLDTALDTMLGRFKLQVIKPLVWLTGRLRTGEEILARRPLDDATVLQGRPVFIVHGAADEIVPVSQALLLKNAIHPVETWIAPNRQHVEMLFKDTLEYELKLADFFNHSLR